MDFNEWLVGFTGELSGFLYTYILLLLLVVVGVYFTIRTKAVQLRYLKDMFSQLTEKKHVEGERSISSFQALMVSTASRDRRPGRRVLDGAHGHRRRGVGVR